MHTHIHVMKVCYVHFVGLLGITFMGTKYFVLCTPRNQIPSFTMSIIIVAANL